MPCRQGICGRVGRSPAVRECFVSTQRTRPVLQPMWLVESVEILRFLLVSLCLGSVHVRCVDTDRRSSAGLLATHDGVNGGGYPVVLMHLLVLGAFWLWRGHPGRPTPTGLNAPSGAGCFLAPAFGSGVVAPLPGAGAPPAPQAPRGARWRRPYLTIFRRPDAKRHRRHLEYLQPQASNDVKPKGRRSRL